MLDQWYVVGESASVTDSPFSATLLGRGFVLWRTADGSVSAAVDRCPHREALLSLGDLRDGDLVCPYHGWSFDGSGACTQIPASGPEGPIPSSAHLDLVAVRDQYGLIWLSPGQPRGEPPKIPEDVDPAFRRLNTTCETWTTSVTRMVDNFCDVAHFPFVHAVTLGADVAPRVAPYHVEDLDSDFVGYRYDVEVDGPAGAQVHQQMTTGFALPFTVRSTTRYLSGPDLGSDRVLLLCSSPIDAVRSLFTFVVWRSGSGGVDDAQQMEFDSAVGAEDRRMLETVPGELPLDNSGTVSVRADRLSVEWRRRLGALAAVASHS